MAASCFASLRKRRVPPPAHSRQRVLCCLLCSCDELYARDLCRSCCAAASREEPYFSGCKKSGCSPRDGRHWRVCGLITGVVHHHRKPAVDQDEWLITLYQACPTTVKRLQQLDRCLPSLLRLLWREKHPGPSDPQLPFEIDGVTL